MTKVNLRDLKKMIKNGEDVSNVDVSKIKNMKKIFEARPDFNQDISKWDVSSVTKIIA